MLMLTASIQSPVYNKVTFYKYKNKCMPINNNHPEKIFIIISLVAVNKLDLILVVKVEA
jgi:ACT domain-containing protein